MEGELFGLSNLLRQSYNTDLLLKRSISLEKSLACFTDPSSESISDLQMIDHQSLFGSSVYEQQLAASVGLPTTRKFHISLPGGEKPSASMVEVALSMVRVDGREIEDRMRAAEAVKDRERREWEERQRKEMAAMLPF